MADYPISLEDIFDQAQSQVVQGDDPSGDSSGDTPSGDLPVSEVGPSEQYEQPRRDVLNHLHAQGMDVSGYQSDDDWYAACEQHEAAINRERSQIDDYQRNRDQYLTWQQQSQQQPVAPTPQSIESKKSSGPTAPSDLAWEFAQKGYIAIDQKTGRYRAVDPTLSSLEKQLNDYTDWQRTQARKIVTKPDEWFEESGLADKFKPKELNEDELFQKFEQRLTQKQQKEHLENQYFRVEPMLFHVDGAGVPTRNAAGDFIPTDLGRQFKDTLSLLQSQGVADQHQRLSIAMSLMTPAFNQVYQQYSQQQNQQQPNPVIPSPVAQSPVAPVSQPLSTQQTREVRQENWLRDKASARETLSPDDARINEAVRASLDQNNHKGSKRLSDLYDEAQNLALNGAR